MITVTAEASHAEKRATGPWARWHTANEACIRAAALHVCFTARDAEGLDGLVDPNRIAMLPPFLDPGPFGGVTRRASRADRVALVTVAMMRPGDKFRSYAFLAEALARLPLACRGISRSSATGRSAPGSSACSAAFRPVG